MGRRPSAAEERIRAPRLVAPSLRIAEDRDALTLSSESARRDGRDKSMRGTRGVGMKSRIVGERGGRDPRLNPAGEQQLVVRSRQSVAALPPPAPLLAVIEVSMSSAESIFRNSLARREARARFSRGKAGTPLSGNPLLPRHADQIEDM